MANRRIEMYVYRQVLVGCAKAIPIVGSAAPG